jgi:hypothetical protein
MSVVYSALRGRFALGKGLIVVKDKWPTLTRRTHIISDAKQNRRTYDALMGLSLVDRIDFVQSWISLDLHTVPGEDPGVVVHVINGVDTQWKRSENHQLLGPNMTPGVTQKQVAYANLVIQIILANTGHIGADLGDPPRLHDDKVMDITTEHGCTCGSPPIHSEDGSRSIMTKCFVNGCKNARIPIGDEEHRRIFANGFTGWDYVATGCPSTSFVQDEAPFRMDGEQKCTILRDLHDISTPGISDGCKVLCRLKSSKVPSIVQSPYLFRSRGSRIGKDRPCGRHYECYDPNLHGILTEINDLPEADRGGAYHDGLTAGK